jgi:hypothetical protein
MQTHTFDPAKLGQFTGTHEWFRHGLNRKILFTEGAHYVAESAGAFWLLDEIAIANAHEPALRGEAFQVWNLAVASDKQATLACEDGNDNVIFTKRIPFTDFPADGVTLWCVGGTILLPSEY